MGRKRAYLAEPGQLGALSATPTATRTSAPHRSTSQRRTWTASPALRRHVFVSSWLGLATSCELLHTHRPHAHVPSPLNAAALRAHISACCSPGAHLRTSSVVQLSMHDPLRTRTTHNSLCTPPFAHASLTHDPFDVWTLHIAVRHSRLSYLPAWWWHQFEQPFEDTGSLNLWSKELPSQPGSRVPTADERLRSIRPLSLHDHLERAAVSALGNGAGVGLSKLAARAFAHERAGGAVGVAATTAGEAAGGPAALISEDALEHTNQTLHAAADRWRDWAASLPGGTPDAAKPAAVLVREFLELGHHRIMEADHWPAWQPGEPWDLRCSRRLNRRNCASAAARRQHPRRSSVCREDYVK